MSLSLPDMVRALLDCETLTGVESRQLEIISMNQNYEKERKLIIEMYERHFGFGRE